MGDGMMPAWRAKLTQAVKQEPQKAAALAALVVVMAVCWWKMMPGAGSEPQGAAAALAPSGLSVAGPVGGAAGGANNAAAAALQEFLAKPIAPLGRNLFAVPLDRFPTDGTRQAPQQASAPVETFWDELAKSMAARAERMNERQAREDRVRAEVRRLALQSTMMGSVPKAMVNGQLVREGDLVKPVAGEGDVGASFRVLRIEPQRIIVEREGIKLTVRMMKSDAR